MNKNFDYLVGPLLLSTRIFQTINFKKYIKFECKIKKKYNKSITVYMCQNLNQKLIKGKPIDNKNLMALK